MFIDIRRAYFHSPVRRKVYVRLPPEDSSPGYCGMLYKSMYGTRDAAQNWEYEYSEFLHSIGFVKGKASPCLFYNKQYDIRLAVHGDDFTFLGYPEVLDEVLKEMRTYLVVFFGRRFGNVPQLLLFEPVTSEVVDYIVSVPRGI